MLILASTSPRRLELLGQIGIAPDRMVGAEIDESPLKYEKPLAYVKRIARLKAEAVAAHYPGAYILACDTMVAAGPRILPKAEDRATAHACLQLLSGRRHHVTSSVVLRNADGAYTQKTVTTEIRFCALTPQEIEAYLDSGEWEGKAGGYAIQGRAAAFVSLMRGSYTNVVGLPLYETAKLLQQCHPVA
jgi:septum formation protein